MNTMFFIGYIENSYANGFQIPIFKAAESYFFQRISIDNTYIEGFDQFDLSSYNFELTLIEDPIEKDVLDFAIYILKFEGNLYMGSRPTLKQFANIFFSKFIPEGNLFFLRDYLSLYRDYRVLMVKSFHNINQLDFEHGELINFMSIIFCLSNLKLETILLEKKESKIRVLQLFEVKSPRSDYYKFLMANRKANSKMLFERSRKNPDSIYYDLFLGK